MNWYRGAAICLLFVFAVTPVRAETLAPVPALSDLGPMTVAIVENVVDARTLKLSTGVEIRLAALVDALFDDGASSTGRAVDLLRSLIGDKPIGYVATSPEPDRHGRTVAHVVNGDGVWLQQALLRGGAARVYPALGETTLALPLYRAEGEARSARAGLWANRANRVRNPSETWADRGTFQIVEGRVYSAAIVRGTGYLNFAEDWRRDFTVSLDREALKRFEKVGLHLTDLEGRRVRARGWVRLRNGPMIDLSDPAQLELLPEN